jgi:outer membrane protein OmpA-like peptidoglycan-associated protein
MARNQAQEIAAALLAENSPWRPIFFGDTGKKKPKKAKFNSKAIMDKKRAEQQARIANLLRRSAVFAPTPVIAAESKARLADRGGAGLMDSLDPELLAQQNKAGNFYHGMDFAKLKPEEQKELLEYAKTMQQNMLLEEQYKPK